MATDADFAPDGSLLLSDWVNGWNGENKGRIYRIATESKEIANAGAESARLLQEGFTHRSTDDLVTLLSNSDRRIRLEAQWELARRDSVTSFANILASDAKGFEKLHAVWGLGQIVRKSKKDQNKQAIQLLLDSLNSLDEYVVARACEVLSETNGVIRGEQLSQLVLHQSSVVRAQAMMAVGKQKAAECLESVAKALMENADRDPIIRHAGIMAFAGALSGESAQWLKHSHESVRIAVAVGLRKAKNPLIAKLLTDESLRVVREAVRAIYDVPELQSQLAELADMTIEDGHDPNIVKRILHANYRLGTPKHASRLIQFAASKLGTDSLRAEAMRLLGEWAKPGLRDRIMNRHSPIPDRDASFIAKILQENIDTLAATPKVVRNEFLKVGAKLKINGITKLLEAIVQDASAEPARRASSIKALSQIQPEKLLEQRDTLLKDSSPTVRIAMMNAVADLSPAKALDSIQSALRSESMQERQAAWDLLGKNQALDSDKVQKLIDDQITQLLSESFPKDTLLNAVEATVNKGSEASKKTINEWTASRDSLLQTKPRDAYIDCLEGGDIENGRELFFTRSNLSCVRCHKIGETGGDVGPNLSAIGKQKDRGYLAEAIVAPDAAIALGFETVVILTEDDENYSGILKSEDAEKLNIMDAQGKVLSIDKTVIAARKKGLSSMPAGLMKFLNRRELRDLVAYMASLDGTPEATIKYGEIGGHQVE